MPSAIKLAYLHAAPVAGARLRLSAGGVATFIDTTTTTTTNGRGWEFVRK